MSITPLPPPPSRSRPTTFEAEADQFLSALIPFGMEANQLASDMQAFGSGVISRGFFSSQEGQTIFVVPGGYMPGNIDVYQNGIKLRNDVDVTVTSGTEIVFVEPLTAGHEIDYVKFASFDSISVYTQLETSSLVDTKVLEHSNDSNAHSGVFVSEEQLSNHISNVSPHSGHVVTTTQVIAGNGLTGGGTLNTSRTLTLATPGTITSSSTNSATALTHTHELTYQPSTQEVMDALVGITVGEVGSLAYLARIEGLDPIVAGDIVAGTTLKYASIKSVSGTVTLELSVDSPLGSWKCLGNGFASLYIRTE